LNDQLEAEAHLQQSSKDVFTCMMPMNPQEMCYINNMQDGVVLVPLYMCSQMFFQPPCQEISSFLGGQVFEKFDEKFQ
jgi:hypothetical protein